MLHLESCGIKEPLQIQPKDLGLLSGHGWIRPAIAGQWRVHSKVVNLESDRCGVGIKGIKIVSQFESAGYSAKRNRASWNVAIVEKESTIGEKFQKITDVQQVIHPAETLRGQLT